MPCPDSKFGLGLLTDVHWFLPLESHFACALVVKVQVFAVVPDALLSDGSPITLESTLFE